MPAYHSAFNEVSDARVIGSMALLPFKTQVKGVATMLPDNGQEDIVDEAIATFRPNSLFKNFEFKGAADHTLVYELLFIQELLAKIHQKPLPRIEAQKTMITHAVKAFALPGDATFPLNAMFEKPTSRQDIDFLRGYLTQLRQETAIRLVNTVYGSGDVPSKWWMCFSKRKFMNLPNVGTAF